MFPQLDARLLTILLVAPLLLGAGTTSAVAKVDEPVVVEEPEVEGLLIGSFMIRDLRPAEGAKLRLSFTLYVEVDEKDADRVRKVIEIREHRLRNAVLTALRTCEQREFQEPELETLRRRIYLRLRRTNPQLPVGRLLIGEFEYFGD